MKYLKSFFENNQEINYIEKYGLYPEDIQDMFYDLQELGYSINVNFSEKLIQKSTTEKTFEFNLQPFISVSVRKKNIVEYPLNQRMVQFDIESLMVSPEFLKIIEVVNSRLKDYNWKINNIKIDYDNLFISICKINI